MSQIERVNNFGEVVPGVYRSGSPDLYILPSNLMDVKTIIKLVDTPYYRAECEYVEANSITVYLFPIKTNKVYEADNASNKDANLVMEKLLDVKNHPILIHCNKGKHRTGCIIGCLRRLQGWDLVDIIQEYRLYAGHKARPLDEEFIKNYEPGEMKQIALDVNVAAWGR